MPLPSIEFPLEVLLLKIIEMDKDVGPAYELGYALHAETGEDADELPQPCEV
jgi:hypothetical protein